jgi:hypothetical protein
LGTFGKITSNVFSRYGPLRPILLCAMGYYGKFGCALWATAVDLVMRYGPYHRIWFCAEFDFRGENDFVRIPRAPIVTTVALTFQQTHRVTVKNVIFLKSGVTVQG